MEPIENANKEAVRRMLAAEPILVDVVPAGDIVPDLHDQMILHAGPPIEWCRMCGPMQGAIAGIAVFEGWAKDLKQAATAAATQQPQESLAVVAAPAEKGNTAGP